MDLTSVSKRFIDNLSYEELLDHWRNAPLGDPWFQGETGEYWRKRMEKMREDGVDHVAISKKIVWRKNV